MPIVSTDSIFTKSAFAAHVGVTPGRVSQWLHDGKLHGDAIVGAGHRARIRVPVALGQLKRNLDIDQRLGANAKARLDGQKTAAGARQASPAATMPPDAAEALARASEADEDTVEGRIKQARLQQIALFNAKAQEEARLRSGRYVLADEARQSAGRIAARMVTMFDGALADFANAIAAKSNLPPREAMAALRMAWREIRARSAETIGAEAEAVAALVEVADDAAL